MKSIKTITVLIFAGLICLFVYSKINKSEKVFFSNFLPKTSPTPTIVPTPTLSPTPTPRPLVGFCLKVPMLMYHHFQPQDVAQKAGYDWMNVSPDFFEKQLAYLNEKGYITLGAKQLAEALINKQKLPAKSIVLTADDGYAEIYTNVFPLLKKYSIKMSLMIPTGLMNNPGYLDWGQLAEMVGSGLVFAYNHTWSHQRLSTTSNEKLSYEILTAKTQLEERLGQPVNIFAYPYGSENSKVINFLRSNGFIAGLSTISGFYQCDSFIFSLHRNRVGNAPLSSYGL